MKKKNAEWFGEVRYSTDYNAPCGFQRHDEVTIVHNNPAKTDLDTELVWATMRKAPKWAPERGKCNKARKNETLSGLENNGIRRR